MTHDELFDKIREYESKWGKLGHTSILHPERQAINHSGIDSNNNTTTNKNNTNTILQKGSKIMNKFTNDFYEFRRKVAQGKEKNTIAHTGLINIDELNERNLRNQFEKNTLIHAGTNQNKDYKYYNKIELPNGDTRYFYTKAEWDAYQEGKNRDTYNAANAAKKTSGGASAQADIEAEARNKYEQNKNQKTDLESVETKKERERQWNYIQNFNREYDSKFSEIARTSGAEAAAKEIVKEPHTRNLLDTISKGFESGKLTYKDGKFETSDEDLQKQIESDSDSLEKLLKDIDKNAGTGKDVKKAVEKIIVSKIEELNNKNKYSSKVNKEKEAGDEQKIEQMIRDKADPKSVVKELVNSEKATKYLQGLIKEAQAGNYDFDIKDGKVIDRDSMDENTKKGLRNFKYDIEDYIENELRDLAKAQGEEYKDAFQENIRDGYYDALLERFTEMFEVAKKTNSKLGKVGKLSNGREIEKTAKTIKQSTPEDDSLTTNGVMSEYRAFKERANKGAAKNKLVHSTFISPEELNARYEEEQRSKCILVHSANYKYYNKIDLGNGNTRYFYTKAEWDAYQDGLGRAKYEEEKKLAPAKKEAENRSDMAGYADWKKDQDNKKQQAETVAKNKAADEVDKYTEILKSSTPEAAAKAYLNDKKVTDFIDKIEKKYKAGVLETYQSKFDDYPRILGHDSEEFQSELEEIRNFGKQMNNKEFDKIINNEISKKIEELNKKYEKERKSYSNNAQSSYHEKDRWIKERINNTTDPDDPWLVKQVNDLNWDAIRRQTDLIIDRQNKNGVKVEVNGKEVK